MITENNIFYLTYLNKCPVSVGQKVTSPIKDDVGQEISFIGEAEVFRIESMIYTVGNDQQRHLVFVKQYYMI